MGQLSARYRAFGGAGTIPPPERTLRAAREAPRALPGVPAPDTATPPSVTRHQRRQARWGQVLWSSIVLSAAIHWAAFAFWPTITAPDISYSPSEMAAIELPPEVEIPPPPEALARPAVPIIATAAIDEDITIAATTFEANPVSELPPPPADADRLQREISEAPTFTPFTVRPDLVNRSEAAAAIMKSYPPTLRDAGIGGTVDVWFFIDETGIVRNTRLAGSSGYRELDEAALAVAPLLRFSPALNRDRAVQVWVQLPILFSVRR